MTIVTTLHRPFTHSSNELHRKIHFMGDSVHPPYVVIIVISHVVIKDFGCHCHRPLPQSRIYAQAFQRLKMQPGGPCRAHFSQHGGMPVHEVRENPCTDGRSVLPLQRVRTTAAAPSGPNGCHEQSSRPVKALLSGRQKPQLTLAPSVLRHPLRLASSIGGRADWRQSLKKMAKYEQRNQILFVYLQSDEFN